MQVMVANGMKERGTSVRQLAKLMRVTEGALRYRLKSQKEPTPHGRPQMSLTEDAPQYRWRRPPLQQRLP